jgi:hypothetical protein
VNQLLRLLNQRLRDFRIGMAQRANSNAAAQIEVSLAVDIPNIRPHPMTERQVEPAVTGNNIVLEKPFDCGSGFPL